MANRKFMEQQKTRRTKDVQEERKAAEDNMKKITSLKEVPPDWLDATAKEEWQRILPIIQELPVAELDLALLSMYCQTYSNYIDATKQLEDEKVVETERGSKLSSYYTIQRDSVNTMNSIAPKLGLTVEARLKILAPKKQDENDEFGEMMNDK